VWKGKDDEDGRDLVVSPVPIYVQEKIVPQALVENLRKTAKAGHLEPEATLFDDFDGLDDLEMVEFYEHDKGNWANRMILGDSLAVMASLAEREDLRGKVQMIYVDPPYGIKFGSNWQVSTRKRDVKDGKAADATRQPEQVRAFRDTWELGIHSYLSYLRDRLEVARDLLTETGSCFVQIGDENVHLVRAVMDEVFGAENFVSLISVQKSGSTSTSLLPNTIDYLLVYARDKSAVKFHPIFELPLGGGA
jgi:adenine-specific DNA-methyltransferase